MDSLEDDPPLDVLEDNSPVNSLEKAIPELDTAPTPIRNKQVPRWRQSRAWRILFPCLLFLLGVVVGMGAILLYALSISGEGRALITPPPPRGGDIVIQVGATFMQHLVERNLASAGLPGKVSNVVVTLQHGNQMIVDGDDRFNVVFSLSVTRHFRIILQPYVRSCQLQMHVIHADMNSIPVTGFVSNFESRINGQLQVKPTGLPQGFLYCTIGVRTERAGLFVTYSAKPAGAGPSSLRERIAFRSASIAA